MSDDEWKDLETRGWIAVGNDAVDSSTPGYPRLVAILREAHAAGMKEAVQILKNVWGRCVRESSVHEAMREVIAEIRAAIKEKT